MNLGQLLECSLPLLAEGDDPDFPYWFGGTCFLLRYDGGLYAITAEHCLRDKDRNQVRVQRRPTSRTFITLNALFTQAPNARDAEDTDRDDWAIFQAVEPEAQEPDDRIVNVIDLRTVPDAPLPPPDGHRFAVRGYPKERARIDFDGMKILWQAYAGTGEYAGRPTWSRWVHTIRMDSLEAVESVDGLSGSPVFLVAPEGRERSYSFAGVVVRGSKESGLLHFLDRAVVRQALDAAHRMRR